MRRRTFLQLLGSAAVAHGAASTFFPLHGRPVVAAEQTSKSAGKIKIGQIGAGHAHAAGKLEAVRRLSDTYELVGVVEPDAALRERVAKSGAYAGVKWLEESELLATPGLTAVVVETRLADSPGAAARAIAAGKHIHLDKPGAVDHEEFKRLRFDAERKGLTVQMGYMLRYNPAFELLFAAVREGQLGEILEVDGAMGKLAGAGLRAELAEIPGHGMFELACHIIDATVAVLGKPERVHALGKASRSEAGALLDSQLAVLEYPRATATIRCNHADPFGGPHRMFRVVGTRGAIEISPLESGQVTLMLSAPWRDYKKGEQKFKLPVPKGRYDGEFADLARVIRQDKKLAWDAAHDVAVHETVLRAAGLWT